MVALETGVFIGNRDYREYEEAKDTERYVLLLDNKGRVFVSGNESTGFDTIHGYVDEGMSIGGWLIDKLQKKGIEGEDLSRHIEVFPETKRIDFEGRSVEVIGILCNQEIKHKLIYSQDDPAGFLEIELLTNSIYEDHMHAGLGRLLEALVLAGTIHTQKDIFSP